MSDGSEDNFGKKKSLKVETILQLVTAHFVSSESKEVFKFYEISEDVFVPVIIKNKRAVIEHDIKTMTRIVKLVPKFKPMLEKHYKDWRYFV